MTPKATMLLSLRNLLFKNRTVTFFTVLIFVVFSLPLAFQLRYFGLDLSLVTIPELCEFRTIREHHWPYWISPLIGAGEPFFANFASQSLYPLRWFESLFPPETGAGLGVALHLALAFLGTFYLARSFSLQRRYAIAAGFFYTFSGTVLNLILHSHYLTGGTWLPWAWGSSRFLIHRRPTSLSLFIFAMSFSLLLFGGEPQSWVLANFLVGLEVAAFFLFANHPAKKPGRILFVGIATFLSALLTLVMSGPTLQEMKIGLHLSQAIGDLSDEWAFTPISWLATVWRGALTEPIQRINSLWSLSFIGSSTNPVLESMTWNRSPYLGFIWLTLLVVGFSRRRFRSAQVVLIVALLFSLGPQTPVFGFAKAIFPLLQKFRYASKYLLPMTLAGSILSASALSSIRHHQRLSRLFARMGSFFVMTSLIAGGIFLAFSRDIDHWLQAATSETIIGNIPNGERLSTFLIHSSFVSIASLVVVLFLWFLARRRSWFQYVVMGLALFDLGLAAIQDINVGPAMFTPLIESPVRELLRDRLDKITLCHAKDTGAVGLPLSESGLGDWPHSIYVRLVASPNIGACDGLKLGVPYSPLSSPARRVLIASLDTSDIFGAMGLGCTHVITTHPISNLLMKPLQFPAYPDRLSLNSTFHIYEVINPLPPAFVSRKPVLFPSESEVSLNLGRTTSAAGIARLVDDPRSRITNDAKLPLGDEVSSVEATWINPSQIHLEAHGKGSAILGVKTVFALGWRATQNSHPLTTLRIAGTHLGVWVEDITQGPIELEYRPPFFIPALIASLAGGVGLALLFLYARRRRTVL